jgi:hypothetical protein
MLLFSFFEDVLMSDFDLAISFPSDTKNTAGEVSSFDFCVKDWALQVIVLSNIHSLIALPYSF